MLGSAILYLGLAAALLGLLCVVKPLRWIRLRTRRKGLVLAATGLILAAIAIVLPAPEHRVSRARTQLDLFAPKWQFSELHSIRIAATPERVYQAIADVRADEIHLFRTLTWIRRGGRPLPESILNAGRQRSLLDIATSTSFARLADDRPREIVIGTIVIRPAGTRPSLTRQTFLGDLPPGFAVAVMNFVVTPDGRGDSIVSTETRVYANNDSARRRFATYWRVIYPGSSTIRWMWLRAIAARATGRGGE
jgi:hypothetical protein